MTNSVDRGIAFEHAVGADLESWGNRIDGNKVESGNGQGWYETQDGEYQQQQKVLALEQEGRESLNQRQQRPVIGHFL